MSTTPSLSSPSSTVSTSSYQTSTYPSASVSLHCVLIGHSINAITAATVLAGIEHTVTLYADEQALEYTLATYTFEHQLQALWQLYINHQQITVRPIPDNALDIFSDASARDRTKKEGAESPRIMPSPPALYWLFYTELPESWRHKTDGQDKWITELNESRSFTQTPMVLSGIAELGTFNQIAQQCLRPWIYYVPFVFLQDGQAYGSMLSPRLWLMGEKIADSSHRVLVLQPLIIQAEQHFITDIATTEFARSAIMSMLATRVSFMNEWSRLADYQNVDITQVATIMGLDNRIGKSYLKAGWGFGGQTLPAEISALEATLASVQVENRLMQAVNSINDDQKEIIFRKFWRYFDGSIEDRVVSIWGGGYKPGSGLTAAAAIHPLLRLLWSYRITTHIYAAEAQAELASLYPDQALMKLIDRPSLELEKADALFIMTWPTTQPLPINTINETALPVFDAQNAFSTAQIESLLGDYRGIGRTK